ncbi:hypothetical protein C8J57DRAFT_1253836 [Mycena rebaudengoi]|nr:hypothetical protein C8J57DRAFT_1253836 [Mycena rebaudengoi]
MGVNGLCSDTLALCILDFIKDDSDGYLEFLERRKVVVSTCGRWKAIAETTASLWTHIIVTQRLPVETLASWLSRASTAPLTVEIIFKDIHLYYRHGEPSSRLKKFMAIVLPMLVEKIAQWTKLVVFIEDTTASDRVLEMLGQQSAPSLRCASIECRTPFFGVPFLDPSPTLLWPSPLFIRGCPRLSRLSIAFTGLRWGLVASFATLTHLELRSLPSHCAPRITDYKHMFESSPLLTHMVLASIPMDPDELDRDVNVHLHMHCLEHLELEFGGDAMARLVAGLVLPQLKVVTLHLPDYNQSGFSRCISRRPELFFSVPYLILRGSASGFLPTSFVPNLLRSFPCIHTLDLLDMDSSLFHCIVEEAASLSSVIGESFNVGLPYLTQLIVSNATWMHLALYTELRLHSVDSSLTKLFVRESVLSTSEPEESTGSYSGSKAYVFRNVLTVVLPTPCCLPVATLGYMERL